MAHFQKDGLWIQGGLGAIASVDEATPFIPGQLGKVMSVKDADGKDPAFYQYVLRYATDTGTPVAGYPAYWRDLDDFVVTQESTSAFGGTTNPTVAGVWLGAYPSAGQYGFIEVGGQAEVAVTDTVVAGERLQLASNTQFKTLAAITITSQATSVAVPARVEAIAVDAVTTSTDSNITALLQVIRNGW
jgi:hypothetical protein